VLGEGVYAEEEQGTKRRDFLAVEGFVKCAFNCGRQPVGRVRGGSRHGTKNSFVGSKSCESTAITGVRATGKQVSKRRVTAGEVSQHRLGNKESIPQGKSLGNRSGGKIEQYPP